MTSRDSRAWIRRRVRVLAGLTIAGFVVGAAQLWYLQILEGPRLAELSERNRVRVRPLLAPRGTLYDRNRLPLVDTQPSFTLLAIPRELENREVVLARLSILLRVPMTELEAALAAARLVRRLRARRGSAGRCRGAGGAWRNGRKRRS